MHANVFLLRELICIFMCFTVCCVTFGSMSCSGLTLALLWCGKLAVVFAVFREALYHTPLEPYPTTCCGLAGADAELPQGPAAPAAFPWRWRMPEGGWVGVSSRLAGSGVLEVSVVAHRLWAGSVWAEQRAGFCPVSGPCRGCSAHQAAFWWSHGRMSFGNRSV